MEAQEIKDTIEEMNGKNYMGYEILRHLMIYGADRQITINMFRELRFVVKAIGSRVFISDGPPSTEAKKREWQRNIRALPSISW